MDAAVGSVGGAAGCRREGGIVGFYERRVLPRLMNRACGSKHVAQLRQKVCQGLAGDVIEIGFGSGHNVPFYPPVGERVVAIEPSDLSWELARELLAVSR